MRGAILPLVLLAAAAGGVLAFLAQRDPRSADEGPVAVARLSDLGDMPLAVTVRMADGADRVEQRQRTGHPCVVPSMGCPSGTPVRQVTVYLVRDGRGSVHAFIGVDPRNGCRLVWESGPDARSFRGPGVFHDACHGSLYDTSGRVVGGPSPWELNQLAVSVSPDGEVYLHPSLIVTGACANVSFCPRPAGSPRP